MYIAGLGGFPGSRRRESKLGPTYRLRNSCLLLRPHPALARVAPGPAAAAATTARTSREWTRNKVAGLEARLEFRGATSPVQSKSTNTNLVEMTGMMEEEKNLVAIQCARKPDPRKVPHLPNTAEQCIRHCHHLTSRQPLRSNVSSQISRLERANKKK